MAKQYTSIAVRCREELTEILIAALSAMGYDSFWEKETGFEAYVAQDAFDEAKLQAVLSQYGKEDVFYTAQYIEEKNWNVEWETHFEPITVEKSCLVRATFHQITEVYPYEIIINPKMSFGTGHHATTYLMLQWQLELDHQGKAVMDAGCGTGILSIMATKRGAKSVLAFDIDEWAIENCKENFELNQCHRIQYFLGTIADIEAVDRYDIVLANINRNILLEEMAFYAKRMKTGGTLLLSGFYDKDAPFIVAEAERQNLVLQGKKEKHNWVALLFSNI